jgi:Arc/MetJ-type ribon-helix-helix transcriptional regulator
MPDATDPTLRAELDALFDANPGTVTNHPPSGVPRRKVHRPPSHRMELRLPDLYRRFIEHETARTGESASAILRRALAATKEWAAWERAERSLVSTGRGNFAPEGVETVRAKAERLKAERDAKEAEIEAWRQKYISLGRPVPGEG